MSSDNASLNLTVLTLTPDNVSNTTITSSTGEVLYYVITEHTKKATYTCVRNAQQEVIASSEWQDVLPDKVTIGNRKPMSLAVWMRRSMIPFKDDISFTDDQGRKYIWKGNSPGRAFELYTADDRYTAPIARFNRSRRIHVDPLATVPSDPAASVVSLTPTVVDSKGARTPATLVFLPRALEIRDLVVVSFLFLEKTHRINETESQNRADVVASPHFAVGTNYVLTNGGVS
ncbi:hypothetical protein NM688_g7191 [Phlebia brevispora]|uniref:Uncharacterized protein n=1 Tax=Phlebia brevispora TaxID=194682 RepID=A0ACC1S876_9APHY|nr:hypothetical protein NM688_g7191 [Phlebia brevispora]